MQNSTSVLNACNGYYCNDFKILTITRIRLPEKVVSRLL